MYVGSDQMAWKHGHIKTESGHIHIGSDQMVWSMAIYMDHSAKTDDHPIKRGTLYAGHGKNMGKMKMRLKLLIEQIIMAAHLVNNYQNNSVDETRTD